MRVFAAYIRFEAGIVVPLEQQVGDFRIHGAVDVCAFHSLGTLVQHGTVHFPFLKAFQEFVSAEEVHAHTGLVAQRKQGDAGVVARAHIHVESAVLMLSVPFGMLSERLLAVAHSVAFDVGLIVHIETQTVAEFVERARLRIVAGADGVHVVLLHHQKASADVVAVGVVARELIVFVHVDALELDGLAIEVEDVSLDFRAAEPHVEAGVLPFLLEYEGVEFGGLGTPLADRRNHTLERHRALGHLASVLVEQAEIRSLAGIEAEITVCIRVVKR